jgi:hypothetical protein
MTITTIMITCKTVILRNDFILPFLSAVGEMMASPTAHPAIMMGWNISEKLSWYSRFSFHTRESV